VLRPTQPPQVDLAPAAAEALATITYRSTVAITLAYDARQLRRPLAGHGFVVPDGVLPIAACTWSSVKWPGRSPEGTALLRVTIRSDALLARSDDELTIITKRPAGAPPRCSLRNSRNPFVFKIKKNSL
jgi:protoporphyrinogen oxidase